MRNTDSTHSHPALRALTTAVLLTTLAACGDAETGSSTEEGASEPSAAGGADMQGAVDDAMDAASDMVEEGMAGAGEALEGAMEDAESAMDEVREQAEGSMEELEEAAGEMMTEAEKKAEEARRRAAEAMPDMGAPEPR